MSISSIHTSQLFAQLDAAAQASRRGTVRSLGSTSGRGGGGRFMPVRQSSENSPEKPSAETMPVASGVRLHTIYTATNQNGRPGAKKQLQTADGFWSCLIDRQL